MRGATRFLRGTPDPGVPDEALMARVQEGEARAFEAIFDRHGGVAFSLAYRMCGRRTMAEDIVQETFLSLWRRGEHYDPARGSVRAWVLGAVRNRAIDSFRHEAAKAGRDVLDDSILEMPGRERVEVEVERNEEAVEVRRALTELPTDQRRVIELAFFGGFSHSQIAELLDLPAGTVKGRMRLGMTKMRLALGTAAGDPAR